MGETEERDESQWLGVIGRSLAYICLHLAELREKDLATQGILLESLGLERSDSANLLATTKESLGELIRRAKKPKGGKRGSKKKSKNKTGKRR